MKNVEKYCDICKSFEATEIKTVTEKNTVNNDIIDDVPVDLAFCKKCGNTVYDHILEQNAIIKITDKYKSNHKLLTSNEIKKIYEKYDLSAKKLASILGFGDNTIYRYIQGAIQDKSHDTVLKFIREPGNFLTYLNENETNLTEKDFDKIFNKAFKLLKADVAKIIVEMKLEISKETIKTKSKPFEFNIPKEVGAIYIFGEDYNAK